MTSSDIIIWHGADSGPLLSPVCIGPDYSKVGPVTEFRPDTLQLGICINGKIVSDAEARARIAKVGVLDVSNVCYDQGWLNAFKPFDIETIDGVDRMIAEAAQRLGRPYVLVTCDFENPKTLSTCCYLLAAAFAKAGWAIRGIANYMTSGLADTAPPPQLGVAPNWRMSPYSVPKLEGGCTFISAYDQGGTNSFCTDEEFEDVMRRAPGAVRLIAIKHTDPMCAERAKKARAAGFKVLIYVGKHDAAIAPALAKTLASGIAPKVRVGIRSQQQAGNWTGGDIKLPGSDS
jgi:hypothetical protein